MDAHDAGEVVDETLVQLQSALSGVPDPALEVLVNDVDVDGHVQDPGPYQLLGNVGGQVLELDVESAASSGGGGRRVRVRVWFLGYSIFPITGQRAGAAAGGPVAVAIAAPAGAAGRLVWLAGRCSLPGPGHRAAG